MNVLITGGCGFLGSNMVKKLLNDDTNIYIVDNLSTGSLENVEHLLSDNVKFFKYDITDEKIKDYINEWQIYEIYNFACPASPKYYLDYPIETWNASILGVKNLLESIKGTNRKLFHSSTSEVYGDALVMPQVEEYWGNVNPIGVRACYDEGKRAAETLIYDYIRKFDVDARVVRIFNTYGPGMSVYDGRVISNFVTQALTGKDITIYGDGNQTRSFCFVDDTIDAIYRLMKLDTKLDTPVNIGNPQERTINEVAEYVKEVLKSDSKIVHLEKMSDDPQKRRPNINKAKENLNWSPVVTYEEGMKKTILYFAEKVEK